MLYMYVLTKKEIDTRYTLNILWSENKQNALVIDKQIHVHVNWHQLHIKHFMDQIKTKCTCVHAL